jgi:hypothetical protein
LINLGLDFLKSKLDINQFEQRNFDKKIEIDYNIQLILTKALAETSGNRITVMEYHDHIKNIGHVSSYYMTCVHEVYKDGLFPISSKLDKIPTSLVSKFLLDLIRNPYVIINEANFGQSEEGNILLIAQAEKQALCVPLKDVHGGAIGYLSLKKDEGFSEIDISVMKDVSVKIGSMMSMFKKGAGK